MRVGKDSEGKERKEARKEEGAERRFARKREREREKGEREERNEEKSGRVVATKPNTAFHCVSEVRGKNRNCKMCNCKLSSGGRTQGLLATSAEGPSQAGLSPFFLPWISSNCSKGLRKQKEREREEARKRERERMRVRVREREEKRKRETGLRLQSVQRPFERIKRVKKKKGI